MARLPTRDDLGPAPSARSGRPIATYDVTAIGRGMESFGKGISKLAADLGSFPEKTSAFDAERRFQEFKWQQQEALRNVINEAGPDDLEGFSDRWAETYKENADQFFRTLPESLKEKYELKLYDTERQSFNQAATYMRGEQKRISLRQLDEAGSSFLQRALSGDSLENVRSDYASLIETNPYLTQMEKSTLTRSALGDIELKHAKFRWDHSEDPDIVMRDLGGILLDTDENPELRADRQISRPDQSRNIGQAAISVRLETGKNDPLEGVSNISADAGGTKSYGNFGLNSQKGGSIFQFVRDYGAELGLTAEPGTAAFDRQWKDAASTMPVALHASEMQWYQDNVATDIQQKLQNAGIPEALAGDPRVQAFFADRVVQQGPASIDGMNKHKKRILKAAEGADDDPVAFLKNMTEADRGSLQNDFPTALKSGVYSKKGHDTRLNGRLRMALGVDVSPGEPLSPGAQLPVTIYQGLYPNIAADKRLELIRDFQNQYRQQRRAASILEGTLPVDPSSTEDRETIDKAFEATQILDNLEHHDWTAADYLVRLAGATSYIPNRAIETLRGMAVNGAAEDRHYAYQTFGRIMRERPGALQAFGAGAFGKDLADEVETFNTLVTDVGLPPKQAIARLDEMRSPTFKARQESLRSEADKIVKELTLDDLTREYSGWLTSRPEPGGSSRRASFMLDAYRDLTRYHYIRSGDIDLAKKVALNEMKKGYNVSEITGGKRLMRNPPENFYPPIQSEEDGDPSYDYFRDELVRAVNEAAGRFGAVEPGTGQRAETRLEPISIDDIYLEANHLTYADLARGNPYPSYGVVWKQTDENGIPAFMTSPRNFSVDVKAAQQRQSTLRRQGLGAERERLLRLRSKFRQNIPFLKGRERVERMLGGGEGE